MHVLNMAQLFKTANSGTISQYFTCYSNNVIAMPMRAQQGYIASFLQ